jgi:hypothetical protein
MPKTPSFEEMFGVGSVPIASYFNLPEGASADTRFSPEARALLGQGEEYAREQAAREAELAAEELLGGAAGMSDEQIQQQLIQNPRMFGTQAIQPLSGYMQYRQSTSPMSDEVLGPVIEAKITDPYHKERFRNRMLQDGLSANDAYDAYLTDEYNNKFEVQLAEAGVPEIEYGKLKTASGKFDPVAVPRAVAAAKAAVKLSGTGKKVAPIDEEVEFLKDAIEQRQKIFEATGRADKLAEDPVLADYITRYERAATEKLAGLRQAPKPVEDLLTKYSSPETLKGQDPVKPTPNVRPVAPELAEIQKVKAVEAQQKEAKAQEAQQIADAEWTRQKMNLEDTLRQFYPAPTTPDQSDPLVGVAYSILDNAKIDIDTGGRTPTRESYVNLIKKKLGLKEDKRDPRTFIAFEEPGNQRTGPQGVTYDELLREWAEQVVAGYENSNSELKSSRQQVQEPNNSGIAEDPEMAKLLDTYAPKK